LPCHGTIAANQGGNANYNAATQDNLCGEKEVILGNVVFKVKGVEKALLAICLKLHHIKVIHSFGVRNLTIRSIKIRERYSTQ